MGRKIELLAPGGDIEAVKAAIVAGANAVYCGLDVFNARNRASNLSMDEFHGAIRLAHEYGSEIFLTLNVVFLEHEIPMLVRLLNRIVNSGVDGIIVQDLGAFRVLKKYFPTLDVHASTQMTTHNEGQLRFLGEFGASRVNLSRELNLPEIKSMTALAHEYDMLTEVFVHGALCIAFSGQCYSSSVSVGNSGNRGRCSQACRDEYEETKAGNKYPLNLKDNSAYFDLPELVAAQVDSLKVEGRIKGAHYVYTVVDTWRKQIDKFIESGELVADDSNLHKVFNRDFTNSFLKGNLSKDMFIDSPRDYSAKHAIEVNNATSLEQIRSVNDTLHNERAALGADLADKVKGVSLDKLDLTVSFRAKVGEPLTIAAVAGGDRFEVKSSVDLVEADKTSVTAAALDKRFRSFGNSTYRLLPLGFRDLDERTFLPFKEISKMKQQLAFQLSGVEVASHVEIPDFPNSPKLEEKPRLSILISDEKDAQLCEVTDADVYFKLPESFKEGSARYIEILQRNPRLIPWFPAVIIGQDYIEATRLLEAVKPNKIVSNNTGVAHKASEKSISWIAGPFLNTTNSHALAALKEELNCTGAFISNEINKGQIRKIARPENFKLMYSIYHPILMMTSRQCFFQRTVGCSKPQIDDTCMARCEKATTITNVKGVSFAVDKQKGGYPSIYNHEQFLNLDIVRDLADLFDEFLIDLTDIGSGSKEKLDKKVLVREFDSFLSDQKQSRDSLDFMVPLSTNAQYKQGL